MSSTCPAAWSAFCATRRRGGQVTAWYVHGPDLSYRVDAANNVICYHADAQANIIAVTDGGGTNLAQYAYTPYGRSLGSTTSQLSSPNPYNFVGSQGVMEELPGLYFMRARYYSADAGVFLSTDPVKKIGPGWQPLAYSYAELNPIRYVDADGNFRKSIGSLFKKAKNATAKFAASVSRSSTKRSSKTNLQERQQDAGSKLSATIAAKPKKAANQEPLSDRLAKGVAVKAVKTATKNYFFNNALVDKLHDMGDLRAGEHAAEARDSFNKAAKKWMPLVNVVKGGYEELGNRGYSLGNVADGWKNVGENLQFGWENPDAGLKSLKEGIDSATALSINLSSDILTGGWIDPDFSGDEIGHFTDRLGSMLMH